MRLETKLLIDKINDVTNFSVDNNGKAIVQGKDEIDAIGDRKLKINEINVTNYETGFWLDIIVEEGIVQEEEETITINDVLGVTAPDISIKIYSNDYLVFEEESYSYKCSYGKALEEAKKLPLKEIRLDNEYLVLYTA